MKLKYCFLFLVFLFSETFSQNINSNLEDFSSNLPIVLIDTKGQTIPSREKITANMKIIYNGIGKVNYLTDPPNNYDGYVGIELRGSSSLSFEKKQYGFETRDSLGNNKNVELLGFPAENDWVLYAPYSDKSLLRNVLAYKLFNEMGHYASRSMFCEVFKKERDDSDYKYHGVYVLFEKIKRDKNRVKISETTLSDTTGDNLTGGYIIKIDKMDGEQVAYWTSSFPPYPGSPYKIYYQYHYPQPEDITKEQKNYLITQLYEFEKMMWDSNFANPETGYLKWMDLNSLIDFFILNEITKNVDGYRLSSYMHKDRDSKSGKWFLGPVWDYNIALGNADYYRGWQTEGFQLEYFFSKEYRETYDSFLPPFWWKKIYDDSYFKSMLKIRWIQLRGDVLKIEKIHSYIDSMTVFLDEAQKRNFTRWNVLGRYIWPNAYIGFTYQNEIKYLKDWLKKRILWIDFALFGSVDTAEQEVIPDEFYLFQNFPNPFNSETVIKYEVPDPGNVKISIFNILGEQVAILTDQFYLPGVYNIRFNASILISGVYIYKMETSTFSSTKKLLLVK